MKIANDSSAEFLLAQIQKYQSNIQQVRGEIAGSSTETAGIASVNFASTMTDALKNSLDGVSQMQFNSQAMIARFEAGEDVELTDVVLSMQKSSLAFEATLQVRNKVMKAYEDIMNMPV
jgi:flagellar hook-basal body complex protein FliE